MHARTLVAPALSLPLVDGTLHAQGVARTIRFGTDENTVGRAAVR
jgi:hypothetical protein